MPRIKISVAENSIAALVLIVMAITRCASRESTNALEWPDVVPRQNNVDHFTP